jgi:SPX domain protein involved in polyphosphate accumulation
MFPQTSELARRIRDAEKDVKRLVAEDYSVSDPSDLESQHRVSTHSLSTSSDYDDGAHEDTDDDESLDALEDRFHDLEEEVATLVADVHDLALYTKLNITGFMKILKVCKCSTIVRMVLHTAHS